MAFVVTCPQCGQSQEVPADWLGNDFCCLLCRTVVPAKQAIDLASITISSEIIERIPESFARKHCVLALAVEREPLHVAIADPTNRELIDKLEFILNRKVKVHFAPREAILEAIDRHYGFEQPYIRQCFAGDLSDSIKLAQQGSVARRFLNVLLLTVMGEQGRRLQLWRRGEEPELCGWLKHSIVAFVPPPPHLVDDLADELGCLGLGEWQKGQVPAWQYGVTAIALGKESVPVLYEVSRLADGVSISLESTTSEVQAQCAKAIRQEINDSELSRLMEDDPYGSDDGTNLPQYVFEAITITGEEIRGYVNALSEEEAVEQIRQQGHFLTRIQKGRWSWIS